MKLLALLNPGLESLCQQEAHELLGAASTRYPQAVEFSVTEEEALKFLYHAHSARRILIFVGKWKNIEEAEFEKIRWSDFAAPHLSLKVEVENVKGIENRLAIAKKVAGKIFSSLDKQKLSLTIDVKNPDLQVVVYWNGKEYFAGIDMSGFELHARDYRVFTHSASCKGDLGYFFVRKSGFMPGNSLLAALVKDGVLAIEAALYAYTLPVQRKKREQFSYSKFPLFHKVMHQQVSPSTLAKPISAFDESQQNILAARKNAQIAGVRELVSIQKMSLDEVSGAFAEKEFDNLIFQITTKDEDKLNEIYHQAVYVLKPKGTLLLIGRKGWEVSISSKFTLVSEEEIERGGHTYKMWLMKKK